MDHSRALWLLASLPVLAACFAGLTRILPPLIGYFAALAVYWIVVLLPLIVTKWRWSTIRDHARLTSPGVPLVALTGAILIGIGTVTVLELQGAVLPLGIIAMVLIAAFINGTLEEVFWRGVLVPDPTHARAVGLAWALFSLWHVALLFAAGVTATGGAAGVVGGAALLGALFWALRLSSGRLGAPILAHVAINAVAFLGLAAGNWPP